MLIAGDGPTRLANLRALIMQAGKQCQYVTSGILIGGLDGTDEWRVKCTDSGTWTIWLKPDGAPEVDRCSDSECR